MVTELNWYKVYPWASWGGNDKLPTFTEGQTFVPSELLLKKVGGRAGAACTASAVGGKVGRGGRRRWLSARQGWESARACEFNAARSPPPAQSTTQPPPRLFERDLIAQMEKHGIGTDATVAEHIQKQLNRYSVGGGVQVEGRGGSTACAGCVSPEPPAHADKVRPGQQTPRAATSVACRANQISSMAPDHLCRGYAEKDDAMAFWPTVLGEALITGYRSEHQC